MDRLGQFYINGEWVAPGAGATSMPVENPASEAIIGQLSQPCANNIFGLCSARI